MALILMTKKMWMLQLFNLLNLREVLFKQAWWEVKWIQSCDIIEILVFLPFLETLAYDVFRAV
jgi:hypothetical protein